MRTTFYPTEAEVNAADREQLVKWIYGLPEPGMLAIEQRVLTDELIKKTEAREQYIMDLIESRLDKLGGCTPWLLDLVK